MSYSTNKKLGNKFETEFCEILFQEGFWTHNLAQNSAGQPADVIAVRNGKAYLIDCKVCVNDTFPFSRIESNQHTAMTLWRQSGNGDGWFALQLSNKDIYMIDHEVMTALSLNQSSIGEDLIPYYGLPLEMWLKTCK